MQWDFFHQQYLISRMWVGWWKYDFFEKLCYIDTLATPGDSRIRISRITASIFIAPLGWRRIASQAPCGFHRKWKQSICPYGSHHDIWSPNFNIVMSVSGTAKAKRLHGSYRLWNIGTIGARVIWVACVLDCSSLLVRVGHVSNHRVERPWSGICTTLFDRYPFPEIIFDSLTH